MAPFANDCTANPTTGRPKYVAAPVADRNGGDTVGSTSVVKSLPSVCTSPPTDSGKNPTSSHPFSKSVVMLEVFAEPSTFELLNVITFASQQSWFTPASGCGEKSSGVVVVCSSRSKMLSDTSSHAPAVLLKLRWNRREADPVPLAT